ncbi:uncharacterized protein EDB91DRAFT_1048188, partial [Suillus paluster]|uniref:uncharacterized protein n=1 Tax=Suillus paluster TaxID=48578 RepID=UPI001B864B06
WELEDISEALGISGRSCYRWRRIFKEFSAATRPPSPLTGHTRTITCALLTAVEDIFAVRHDIIVSTSTLSCNLKEAGLTCKILRKLASGRDEAQQEEFRGSQSNDFIRDGSEFVVIDVTVT